MPEEKNIKEVSDYLNEIPDDVLGKLMFSVPWQYYSSGQSSIIDADGFPVLAREDNISREKLQTECWNKFNQSPQVSTAVRGLQGRLTGMGFDAGSEIFEIDQVIKEITYDKRNRLYTYWPKYVARTFVEGELFLCLTLHSNGFVEVDFTDPISIKVGGVDDTGIIYHPTKTTFPLYYNVGESSVDYDQIPSIYVGMYPELEKLSVKGIDKGKQKLSRSRDRKYNKLGGFFRFMVHWDKGFMTRRTVSYLRTILEWVNHYENLKKYEIDHKKSSGSYLWIFTIEDPKSFKLWLGLSDEDKKKTGILSPKVPGGSLVLPPGMKAEVINPNLPSITNQDADILEMVGSGLNEPSDIMTGSAKGNFASVKASRGPMSDRVSDEVAYFERFLKHDFWSAIFFLRSAVTDFPETFGVKRGIGWKKGKKNETGEEAEAEAIIKIVQEKPEFLVDIDFPTSEMIDFEGRARGLLGTKHGNLNATLGIPHKQLAKKIGFNSYGKQRLEKAVEDETYPKLQVETDSNIAESMQEKKEGEPKKKGLVNDKEK